MMNTSFDRSEGLFEIIMNGWINLTGFQPFTYNYITRLSSIVSPNLNILQHIARLVMSNKNRIGYVAIALVAALLATVATVPLKYAAAQNATSSEREEMMTEAR
jgi:hypothetical protein